ncbi:MAG: hypothetical protein NC320_11935 [Clostridium sp.]|nr:hypothetical protein [Clostridium sp.]MCM1548247.1 hypothetical protein [Ruminococcus sp.]
MKRKPYRVILIPAAICTIIMSFLAFYITGVIDRAETRELIGDRIDMVCENIDNNKSSSKKLNDEIYKSYCSRARVVSMLLNKNAKIFSDEASFEEMRVAIGADVISVTDKTGTIIYSTDMSVEKTSALEEFMPAIENKVFSDALLSGSGKNRIVVTGSSRLDQPGIIQIQFMLESYQQQLDISELSTAVTQMPVMNHGHLAIIDPDENIYISHTDSYLNGAQVQFPDDEFSEESDWFSSEYEGKSVLVKYKKHDGLIVMGMLPYSEIYIRRNTVLKWIIFSMTILTIVIILSLRDYILKKFTKKSE